MTADLADEDARQALSDAHNLSDELNNIQNQQNQINERLQGDEAAIADHNAKTDRDISNIKSRLYM